MEFFLSYVQTDFIVTLRSAILRTFRGDFPDVVSWDWHHVLWESSGSFRWTPGVTPLSNSETLPLTWAVYVDTFSFIVCFRHRRTTNSYSKNDVALVHECILLCVKVLVGCRGSRRHHVVRRTIWNANRVGYSQSHPSRLVCNDVHCTGRVDA